MISPPNDREKFLYVRTNKLWFYIPSLLSTSTLLVGLFLFATSSPSLWWYAVYGIVLLVYLGLSFSVGIFSAPFDFDAFRRQTYLGSLPDMTVDIFLPSCGEPLATIQNTILGAKRMASYHGRSIIYVLDDADSDELKAFAESEGVEYVRRPVKEHKKAGNIRYAFARTNGEAILILDADFVPREDMLNDMLPHMKSNVATVQSPQFFRVQDGMNWIEKGAGFVQELFYRLIQVNRNHFGAPVCVGTCALYRRKALEPFGGTALIDYSEDLHTGFSVMTHGWQVKYIPVNLAAGECPQTLAAYFTQQYRWCMGSVTLLTTKEFWFAKRIGIIQKACFMTGMLYYIATAASIVMTTVPSLIVLWFFPHLANRYSVMFSLPSFLVGTVVIALWSKHRFGVYAIEARVIAYWAHLFAIIDKARGNLMPWVPTGVVTKKNSRFLYFKWAFLTYSLLMFTLLCTGAIVNMENVEIYPMVALTTFYRLLEFRIVYFCFSHRAPSP